MEPPKPRSCPKCQSKDYLFRSRRTIKADQGDVVEAKFRCRACSNEWRETEAHT